jgi:hypothetical protein
MRRTSQIVSNPILAASAVALTMTSFLVVAQGASDEPYFEFRKSDALVQVGVAMMLMLLWAQLAITLVVNILRHKISKWWFALLFWILICEFYLSQSPFGYVEDITRYVAQSH